MKMFLPKKFDAAVFDFDGTLVDTLELHYRAYREVFLARGTDLTSEVFYRVLGGKASETIPLMAGTSLCQGTVHEIHHAKKAAVARLFAQEPIPLLASSFLIPLLRDRVPLALVSSGSRPGIEQLLARVGWSDCFTVIITGEDVARGKPHPEPYLLAAKRLMLEPAGCLVFEDSDAGIDSAQSAGMAVMDVRHSMNKAMGECS
jgi:beta-phosphoglucomutase-like phosphatase (HAD superfamily)